jgi:outer membrane lipopolysaccharide assembly protein LptE/RlpB
MKYSINLQLFVCVALSALALYGCGYHLAGTGSSLPTHIKTIGLPIFVNNTQGYQVEQKLTSSVQTVLLQRGKYRVVPQAQNVDALLKGTIVSVSLYPVTFGDEGRARQYNVIITAKVTFTDLIQKKVLFQNPSFIFRGQYEIDPSEAAYFDRQSQAIDDIARDFAESVVSAILEGF